MLCYRKSLLNPALAKNSTPCTRFQEQAEIRFLLNSPIETSLTSCPLGHNPGGFWILQFLMSLALLYLWHLQMLTLDMDTSMLQVSTWKLTLPLTPEFWFLVHLYCVPYFTFMFLYQSHTILSLSQYSSWVETSSISQLQRKTDLG